MTTTARKTLTMKSKHSYGMWQAPPSKVQDVEDSLKQSVKAVLDQYANTAANNYVEEFRRSSVALKQLNDCLKSSYEDLQASMKYPNQTKQVFEKMTGNVQAFLAQHGMEGGKFNEALHGFLNPKEYLPKVELTTSSYAHGKGRG